MRYKTNYNYKQMQFFEFSENEEIHNIKSMANLIGLAQTIEKGINFKFHLDKDTILYVTFEDVEEPNDKREIFINGFRLGQLFKPKSPAEIENIIRCLHDKRYMKPHIEYLQFMNH